MDERLGIFLWTLAGAFSFALLGGLFGSLAGWLNARHGHASGTILGRKAADAVARLLERELTATGRAALVGAADGALFLGLIGTLIGLIAGQRGQAPAAWLVPAFAILLLLVIGAVFFGLLAYGLVRLRIGAVAGVFVGGMGGALFAAHSIGPAHIVPGAVAGILLGVLVCCLYPRS
jgi:hypothetical protein